MSKYYHCPDCAFSAGHAERCPRKWMHCAPAGAVYRDPNPDRYRTTSYVREPRPDDTVALRQAGRHASAIVARTGDWRTALEVGEDYLRDAHASYAARLALPDAIVAPPNNCQCDRCGVPFYSPRPIDLCGPCIADRYL